MVWPWPFFFQGKALSFIPVSGDGTFIIEIQNLKFYAHTFLAYEKDLSQLLLKDLDIQVRYDDIDFEFQNLMGGGLIGRHVAHVQEYESILQK